jgi:hypothetical protein
VGRPVHREVRPVLVMETEEATTRSSSVQRPSSESGRV